MIVRIAPIPCSSESILHRFRGARKGGVDWLISGNELRVPLVCLGTREAREALLSDPQLVRRFEGFELPRWQRGEEFYGLVNTLLRTLPLRRPSRLGTKGFDQVLVRADGITANIFTLMTTLAVAAIRSGQEEITAADIRRSGALAAPLDANPSS